MTPLLVFIADPGATDHMSPDCSAFSSYHPMQDQFVALADSNLAPVSGIGSIKISSNGNIIGIGGVLHVPSL